MLGGSHPKTIQRICGSFWSIWDVLNAQEDCVFLMPELPLVKSLTQYLKHLLIMIKTYAIKNIYTF
jgi:hypothetical protein